MKTKYILLSLVTLLLASCNDVLDRPSKTDANDDDFWVSEQKVKLFSREFYAKHFLGYGVGFSSNYAPLMGYEFSDDMLNEKRQREFERTVPQERGSTNMNERLPDWLYSYSGPTWNFAWVRKANLMINRVEKKMENILSDEAYNHWIGVGRFFRGMEYANLTRVFGDVPYYDEVIADTNLDQLYKPRTKRDEVMDHVYDDFLFALENVRLNDGDQTLNRYSVAGFVSRLALYEGTTQKYYYKNEERSKKFLQLAVKASDIIRDSGKFDIVTDFRSLFGSEDLKGNKDCILYRHYDRSHDISHSVATYCNLAESRAAGPTLDLIKAFICNDGNDFTTSTVDNAKDFSLANMIKTRDPRFEATFWDKPTNRSKGSYLYIVKFIDREGPEFGAAGLPMPEKYTSNKNVNDYPVLRYSETLLNWIEAKAELATLGEPAVTQADIDASINKIRNRPLDKIAEDKGVKKTAPMQLANLPNDPNRDTTVSQLIWEIRRERRMEFAFEFSRIVDLRRWGKVEYLDTHKNQDLLCGTWVNFPEELPEDLDTAKNIDIISVIDANGNQVIFDGSNKDKMVGFFKHQKIEHRLPFLNELNVNPYLAPVGKNNMTNYKNKGYVLTQTEGWPQQ